VDFFVQGYLKELIYRDQLSNMEDFMEKLHAAMASINADILQQVFHDLWFCVGECRVGIFEHLI
jgi:hypothetical protein